MALKNKCITLSIGNNPQTVSEAANIFLTDCKARNLSPSTLTLNTIILSGLGSYLNNDIVSDITSTDLRKFFVEKASATTPATSARYYNCINCFFKFLKKEEFIESNPMQGIERPHAPTPIIQPLSQEQVEAIVNACGNGFAGFRNRLILLLLMDTGLRASEACGLTLSDIDWENQTFIIRHGKGDKARRVPFGSTVASVMRQYIARRAESDNPRLLVTVYGEKVDRYRLRSIIKCLAQKAHVEHPHMGPHLLRHTFAVQYLRNGGDVFSLQKMLGHSTLTMTRRYSELADSDIIDKHRLFSPADRLQSAKQTKGRKRLK